MSSGSLRLRIFAGAAISIALALFLTGVALVQLFERQVRARVVAELENDLLQLVGVVEFGADGKVSVKRTLADPRFGEPYSGRYWRIDFAGPGAAATRQPMRSRSLWDADLDPANPQGPEGEKLVVVAREISLDNGGKPLALWLTVAAHDDEVQRPLEQLRDQLVLSLGLIGSVLTLGAWIQATVGLSPLVTLRHRLADVSSGEPRAAASVVHRQPGANADADRDESALQAARREKELGEREQAVTKREALLDARAHELELAAATAKAGPPPDPDAERLAQIELRLTELRDAEKLFLRTRDELAARSEAVAARERLVSQRERELDERDDPASDDRIAGRELSEMEARLRRLEQGQQDPREQTLGFSGGLKKLEQGTRQQRPS